MVDTPLLSPEMDIESSSSIWVIFSDETDIRMLKWLRRGFRHCFLVMIQDERWILIDPRSNKTDISLLPHPSHFNFPRYFMQQGKTVIKVNAVETPYKIAPLIPFSCVETIKRILGIHKRFVLTPYQLYQFLQKG